MSQGRTAVVERVDRGGTFWYRKQNVDPRVTELEHRLYLALAANDDYALEAPAPAVEIDVADPCVLYVEDLGTTLDDTLHSSRMDITDIGYFMRTTKVRSALNIVINAALTSDDKAYLKQTQRQGLGAAVEKLTGAFPSAASLDAHFWAYRVMQAIGVKDEGFRDAYTTLVGSRIDQLLAQYGQWNADNCLRNNTISADPFVLVVPFDLNSLRYELRQMDEAGVGSFYMFSGPLGSDSSNTWIPWLAKRYVHETGKDASNYREAYMLGSMQKHIVLSGYRTQEMRQLHDQLQKDLEKHGWISRQKYIEFRRAYDEVEYHEHIWQQSALRCPGIGNEHQKYDALREIGETISRNTRFVRTRLMLGSVMGYGEQLLRQR